MQTAGSLATAYLALSGLWTAGDPFVGKWKLDVPRSVIVDRMVIEAAGPNRYAFRFEGGPTETVVADGTDQPGLPGTTLSVKAEDSRTVKVVRKEGGRVVVSASWKVSADDRTLRDTFTAVQPDGTSPTTDYVYRRMSGASGFVGAWESTTSPVGLKFEMQIQPYGREGLSFVRQGSVKSVTFDGHDHPVTGAPGQTASGRRRGERAMEVTDMVAGKGLDTQAYAVSPDGKTLTMNVHRAGQATPDRFVFERE
ncbi:MAG: hypothetical protein ACJ798_13090 [Phenylobacterium sp.]